MLEGAGAGLLQQSGQDLASWEYFPYIYCARGEKSCLCGTYQAHCIEEDILLDVDSFEGGHHTMARHTITPGACTAIDYTPLHFVL